MRRNTPFLERLLLGLVALVPLSLAAQTEIEPNNNSAQATPLAYSTAMAGSTGACSPTDNTADYFSFTPTDQGVLRVQMGMSNSGATPLSVTVNLHNSSTSVIQTWTATAGANDVVTDQTFTHLCTGLGQYYITVENPSGAVCTSYSFSYEVLPPVFGADAEPNNNSAQATSPMAAGADHDGRIDFRYGDATDYYRIQAPNDGVMTVTVIAEHAGATAGTMTLRLRNSSSSEIELWTVNVGANGSPASNSFTHRCSGTELIYFLSFEAPSDCGVSYRFSYSVQQPLYADDQEPNGNAAQAIVAAAGIDHNGRLSFDYDNASDWYRLQAPNDGVMTVNILAEHSDATAGTVTLRLRNSSSTQIEEWTATVGANGIATANSFIHYCTGTELVYYLSIESPDVCGTSYRFNYSVAGPVHADDPEPNQNAAQAIIANAGTNYVGRLSFDYDNTTDWYRLQAPNDGVITVNIQAEHAQAGAGTLTAHLRNSSSTQLEQWTVNIGPSGTAQLNTFTRNCMGTELVYYLSFEAASVCGVSYQFNYSVAAPVFGDDNEPNNNSAQAPVIVLNAGSISGRVNFEYDDNSDWYEVHHPGGILTVDIEAENAGAAGTMTVRFRNSSSTQIALNAIAAVGGGGIPATSTTATQGDLPADIYYIEVQSNGVCGVSYELKCYDDDNDGVCNASDPCAGTPGGEGVNSSGCSCSQVVIDDNDVCTLDECLNGEVTHTFQDADNDLTCDANDGCPNDPDKIAPGDCGCGNVDEDLDTDGITDCIDPCPGDPTNSCTNCNDPCYAEFGTSSPCAILVDTDSDGTCDANDNCPNDPNPLQEDSDGDAIGDACDACPLATDGIPDFDTNTCACELGYFATITDIGGNDVITACTICPPGTFCPDGLVALPCPAGRYQDQEGQTACIDCAAGTFNPSEGATSCLACDAGTFSATTGASSCTACPPGFANDQTGQIACGACPPGSFSANSGQAVCDLCPVDTYNPLTAQTECLACPSGESSGVGATACTPDEGCTDYILELQSGSTAPNAVTYEVLDETGTATVLSGNNPFPADAVGTLTLCLPDGCYQLRVTDNAGDGLLGYELRETGMNGRLIIANSGNMSTGASQIANGGTFCVPIGDISLIHSNCDKLDWVNYQYLVCHADANVSAQWQVGNQNNDGYNFWIFDPNGTYSFRRFHTHAVSDGFSPASATRAARIKINGWNDGALTPHIPTGVLLNVRVRGVYNWNFTEWGPTCTMKMDPAAAACPQVWLQDDPNNTSDYSCGVTRNFGGPNSNAIRITAKPPQFQPAPLAGGTGVRYQFRFRLPAEGVCIVRPPQTSPTLNMNWSAASGPQLEASKTYEVEVRVSKDQGATWCVDAPSPACDPSPVTTWGRTCDVTIASVITLAGESSSIATQDGTFSMYPNPNNGEQLFISLTELGAEVSTVSVDIYDMTGKRFAARTIAVAEGFLNTTLEFNGELASGLYMVNITAGERTYNERLVIQR